jgi:hypothetical protein
MNATHKTAIGCAPKGGVKIAPDAALNKHPSAKAGINNSVINAPQLKHITYINALDDIAVLARDDLASPAQINQERLCEIRKCLG